ncbi:UNVERIFIED_CONTAM: hypothetical protein GTU68_039353 [Idotea baltica]|nr:hypothetical protein [Idotea baltica]
MKDKRQDKDKSENEIVRLNKFIARCGVTSRRKAGDLVKAGHVEVNGAVEINPAYQVQDQDVVTYEGKTLKPEEDKVYLLMNKPKDVVTTMNDEQGRRTVYDMIKSKVKERVYPVGRLDRYTTGLLVMTNDGDLAQKLSHPKYEIQKMYEAILDRELTKADLQKVRDGLTLEDGLIEVDQVDYVSGKEENHIGIGLHSGRNRIIRRIFESMNYRVVKLDRTYYAGLTKRNLGRGRFRHLSEREVIMLKHFI